jgi:hypothetical protein
MNIFSYIKKVIKAIPKKIESFFLKVEKEIDEFFFGKPKPQPQPQPKPKEEEEERKPVTLTVSTELYVGNRIEKIDIVRQFPSRQDALQNIEKLAIEILNQNRSRASAIAKSVSYRIDDSVEEKYPKRVVADVHKEKK